jgi:hypothetical protein
MPATSYPFADLTLARRLEKTEAQGNVQFIEARAKAFPALGAEWIEVAGTRAMFDGPTSPISQTFGLGMFQPVTKEDFDKLEHFFQERGAPVFHEVSPLADPTTFELLNERGYKPIEFTSVLFRPIGEDIRLDVKPNELIDVHVIEESEREVWCDTSVKGWSEFAELSDFLNEMGQVQAVSETLSFLATLNDKPIATGLLAMFEGVALLAGASTIPEARRQGAQLALLEGRLRFGAAHGCNVAMMAALPGSASQRNAERHGFRIAYTRIKWHKSE